MSCVLHELGNCDDFVAEPFLRFGLGQPATVARRPSRARPFRFDSV